MKELLVYIKEYTKELHQVTRAIFLNMEVF